MRRPIRVLVVAVALFTAAFSRAEPTSQLRPSNYVNDFAQILNAETIVELNDVCQQLDQKAKAKVAVVTINTTDSVPIEDYAVDLFKQWGLGTKDTNRGVLILLAVKDRRYRTEVGYGLEPILPDGRVGGFWREAVPLLKANDYSGAVKLTTERVAVVIAQDAGVQLTGIQAQTREHREPHFPRSSIILLIIAAIIVLAIPPLRHALFWWLLFSSTTGGYRSGGGSWGGGGFGGGGGGGFGGFGGGGMSGGGGASGSW